MSAFAQRSLAFAMIGLAAAFSNPTSAQPAASEAPDEVTVRGQKSLTQYRVELERAREEIFALFNESNQGDDTDIRCKDEQPTGSRMRQNVCRSNAENRSDAAAATNFLNSLLMSSGQFRSADDAVVGGTQANANVGTGAAQGAGASGREGALDSYQEEWKRVLGDNPKLFEALVAYIELEDEYNQARGLTVAPTEVVRETITEPTAPLCEATTLTEYFQRNNLAHVSGTVNISSCPAGTSGSFKLVARVRDENGEIKPIEFDQTWQRDDAERVSFESDYPIGENVELVNVRVRGLTCTCAAPAQPVAQ